MIALAITFGFIALLAINAAVWCFVAWRREQAGHEFTRRQLSSAHTEILRHEATDVPDKPHLKRHRPNGVRGESKLRLAPDPSTPLTER